MTFQKKILDWAIATFGSAARNRDERAARVVEEAIELAQCEGVPIHVVQRIAERVYSRPPGHLPTEIADVEISLCALAENVGISVYEAQCMRWTEFISKGAEHWANKHRAKVAAGTADLPPQDHVIQPPGLEGVPAAMKVITEALRRDRGYWMGWQANIAMTIYDTKRDPTVSNLAWLNAGAQAFLELLCREPEPKLATLVVGNPSSVGMLAAMLSLPSTPALESLPKAYGGCTCDCHRIPNVVHVTACCGFERRVVDALLCRERRDDDEK